MVFFKEVNEMLCHLKGINSKIFFARLMKLFFCPGQMRMNSKFNFFFNSKKEEIFIFVSIAIFILFLLWLALLASLPYFLSAMATSSFS